MSGEVNASTAAQTFDDARQVRAAINERLDDANLLQAGQERGQALIQPERGGVGHRLRRLGQCLRRRPCLPELDPERLHRRCPTSSCSNTTRLGIAAGFVQSAGNVDSLNSKADNSHTDLALYGVSQVAGFIAKYGAAYSWNDISTSRSVAFGSFSNGLASSYNGNTGQLFGEVSRRSRSARHRSRPSRRWPM